MAPTITSTAECPKEHLNLSHKLRKPIVEKMRRDRINNSIEELKTLLGPQLLDQQPDSKLEKADILEMTVCLLRRQLQQHKILPSSDTVHMGVSRWTHEDTHFLSEDEAQTQYGAVLSSFQTLKTSSDEDLQESALSQFSVLDQHTLSKENGSAKSAPWRPW